jgi:hypothetical protein
MLGGAAVVAEAAAFAVVACGSEGGVAVTVIDRGVPMADAHFPVAWTRVTEHVIVAAYSPSDVVPV